MRIKNVKAYLYMAKIKLLLSMSYRFDFFTNLAVQVIFLFTSTYFWKAAYKGVDTVQSVNEEQMLIYSVMSIVLGILFSTSVESKIKGSVRSGNVALDYLKPVNIFVMYFFEDIGNIVTAFIQSAVVVLLCSSLFIVLPIPVSIGAFFLFLFSVCLSYLLLWLMSAIVGLLYFKVIDMGPIGIIKDYLIKIFSGSFVPIWFFPKVVQDIFQYLPFVYTYQLPLSIYIGKTDLNEALKGISVQFVWVAVFFFIFARLKNRIETNVFVQGG